MGAKETQVYIVCTVGMIILKCVFSSHALKDAKIEERAKDEREQPSQVYIQASFPDFPLIILELQHTSEASKADLTLQSTKVTFELHVLYINSDKRWGDSKMKSKTGHTFT